MVCQVYGERAGTRGRPENSLEQIEQFRRPTCGTTADDQLTITDPTDRNDDDESDRDDEIDAIETAARKDDLVARIRAHIATMEDTDTGDDPGVVAPELRVDYHRLGEVQSTLNEAENEFSLETVAACETYVEEIEAWLEEKADVVAQIERRKDREAALERLEADITQLKDERSGLTDELKRLQRKVGSLEDVHEAYEEGYADGREDFQILISCSRCGEPMKMDPGSEMHHRAVQVLS